MKTYGKEAEAMSMGARDKKLLLVCAGPLSNAAGERRFGICIENGNTLPSPDCPGGI